MLSLTLSHPPHWKTCRLHAMHAYSWVIRWQTLQYFWPSILLSYCAMQPYLENLSLTFSISSWTGSQSSSLFLRLQMLQYRSSTATTTVCFFCSPESHFIITRFTTCTVFISFNLFTSLSCFSWFTRNKAFHITLPCYVSFPIYFVHLKGIYEFTVDHWILVELCSLP